MREEAMQLEPAGYPSDTGRKMERGHLFSGDLSKISFHKHMGTVETGQFPYTQVEYGERSDGTFAVITYAEGDLTRVLCPTREELDHEVKTAEAFYVSGGWVKPTGS